MTISIWRYSHLALAAVASLFLIIASLTGIVLAVEPVQEAWAAPRSAPLDDISVGEAVRALTANYGEVLALEVDANDGVIASVVTKDGEGQTLYVDPRTGEALGTPQKRAAIYQWTTNLHRSLFLKGVGRFFVGLVSFLLCLIAVSGLVLIAQRQGGPLKLFSKVQKDHAALYYHVVLGRWLLLPIVLIAASGVYLSAEQFSLLPKSQARHTPAEVDTEVDMTTDVWEVPFFMETALSEVRTIAFPFSEMPEDYFELALKDRELRVHQYTGAILSEVPYPFTTLAARWSVAVHTGQGAWPWALVLLLASMGILYFIQSGFVMWRKRTQGRAHLPPQTPISEADHVILVGSETGTTFAFAHRLRKALVAQGKQVHIAELNQYTTYENAKKLLVLTATYGAGEAPTNARKFASLLQTVAQPAGMHYAVVGFGSLRYPDYCAFATQVDQLLQTAGFERTLPLFKINNQDKRAFSEWAKQWGKKTQTPLLLKDEAIKKKRTTSKSFTVVERTNLNADDTFLVRLRPKEKLRFQSGDLAGIIPEDGVERLYSIAKIGKDMLLSVKKHEMGVCSPQLSELRPREEMHVRIKRNTEFHFPKHQKPVALIANGTGIAPFLGMLHENKGRNPVHCFLGLRNKSSLDLYADLLLDIEKKEQLSSLNVAYSREGKKQYVQELVRDNKELMAHILSDGGPIFICGSLAMQNEVLAVLEDISKTHLNRPLSDFEASEQLKMDCY
ncbi:PepSY domain-containing protein [Maribacter sp. 2307ULW6-5]|uniref:PepSY domain-containing protein n=1 Tax=Maribacter sp. 2307ULW6-5 TaxID=3386275 RepID=UPI0039BD3150